MAGDADSICPLALSLRDKEQWSHASLECSAYFQEELNINLRPSRTEFSHNSISLSRNWPCRQQ